MAEAVSIQCGDVVTWTADGTYTKGDVIQLKDGRAAVVLNDVTSGNPVGVAVSGVYKIAKTASIVLLSGGRLYWDHSANAAHFKTGNDRDFFVGMLTADAASADTVCYCNLNKEPVYSHDLHRDSYASVNVGTVAAGGFGFPRRWGGAQDFALTSTNEAQKTDALADYGFATGANAIVEFRVNVVSDGAGSNTDFNIGIASATHASDADSIAKHLFLHLDGNSANINFQSKDGTTTVAATDSTVDYTEGTPFEVWMDMRDPADVQIYVDGVLVLGSTVFDVSASASTWFLLEHIEKASSTDTYEGKVEFCRARLAQV